MNYKKCGKPVDNPNLIRYNTLHNPKATKGISNTFAPKREQPDGERRGCGDV